MREGRTKSPKTAKTNLAYIFFSGNGDKRNEETPKNWGIHFSSVTISIMERMSRKLLPGPMSIFRENECSQLVSSTYIFTLRRDLSAILSAVSTGCMVIRMREPKK